MTVYAQRCREAFSGTPVIIGSIDTTMPGSSTVSQSSRSSSPATRLAALFSATDRLKLAVFSTGPAIRNVTWNFVSEVIGTFALMFVVLAIGVSGMTPCPRLKMYGPPFHCSMRASTRASRAGPPGELPACPRGRMPSVFLRLR